MIPSRLAVSSFIGLASLMVSLDPTVTAAGHARAPARPDRRPIAAERAPATLPARADLSTSTEGPAPVDLKVEVTPEAHGHRVVVRRPGHLVALQYGAARAAGQDWAAVHVELAPSGSLSKGKTAAAPAKAAEARSALVWEATPLSALTTERGVVALRLDGADLHAEASRAAAPEPAGASSGPHHTCAAHRDPRGGFTVLCRLHHGARRVAVANVTGPRALDNAWVMPGKDPLIRLDLPLAEGLAEARVVGFVHGITGAVLRAEASWPSGESPALVLEETERSQPLAADLDWR
jgi:hypothetical protein